MSTIFHLSKYILLPIYNEWLDASDFCHMDTSICNHLERNQFFQLIGQECVKFPGLNEDAVCTKYLKWVAARNLRITYLVVEKQLLFRIFTESLPSFVNLKYLVINHYVTGFSVRLRQLLCVCTQLKSFRLSTSKDFGCDIIETLSKNCTNLESIELEFSKPSYGYKNPSDEIMISLVKSCPCLTAVKLSNFVNLKGNFITAFADNCSLKELSIKNMPQLTAEQLGMLVDRCPDMTEISVKGCGLITVDDFNRILAKCSSLKTVCLRTGNFFHSYSESSSSSLVLSLDVLMQLVHITTLKLCSVNVTNEVLEMITIGCSQLSVLELTNQKYLTHDGFMHIAKHCRNLTELSLAFCKFLEDVSTVAIINSKFIRLNLNECHSLTDTSLQHIMSTCPSLTSLSIGGNRKYFLSTEVYAKLMKCCAKLSFLNISNTNYANIEIPKYMKRNGKVVYDAYKLSPEVPHELFTKVIMPNTSLRELRLRGMKIKQGTLTMLKDTHKMFKVVHGGSMISVIGSSPYDSE